MDECLVNPKICRDGSCSNTVGSYKCVCPPGYHFNTSTFVCQGKKCPKIGAKIWPAAFSPRAIWDPGRTLTSGIYGILLHFIMIGSIIDLIQRSRPSLTPRKKIIRILTTCHFIQFLMHWSLYIWRGHWRWIILLGSKTKPLEWIRFWIQKECWTCNIQSIYLWLMFFMILL